MTSVNEPDHKRADIGPFQVDVLTPSEAIHAIVQLLNEDRSSRVHFANAHMYHASRHDDALARACKTAKLVLPDGIAVAALASASLRRRVQRTPGPDLIGPLLRALGAVEARIAVFGSDSGTLQRMEARFVREARQTGFVARESPPFGSAYELSEEKLIEPLIKADPDVIIASLGCPKQEIWMREMAKNCDAVYLGLGAAVDFYAGKIARAPTWTRNVGLEWAYRWMNEPRRLTKRNVRTTVPMAAHLPLQITKLLLRRS